MKRQLRVDSKVKPKIVSFRCFEIVGLFVDLTFLSRVIIHKIYLKWKELVFNPLLRRFSEGLPLIGKVAWRKPK